MRSLDRGAKPLENSKKTTAAIHTKDMMKHTDLRTNPSPSNILGYRQILYRLVWKGDRQKYFNIMNLGLQ